MDYKLFGAIGGDISGVYYEGAHCRTKEYDEVRLIRAESTFSDDTVCTIAIAVAVYCAREQYSKQYIKDTVLICYPEYIEKTLDEIRPGYKFDSTCQGSVPIAIMAFLESEDYEDCLKLAISMGGDSDTIAAMAGSIAYPYYKKMSSPMFDKIWDVLPDDMIDVVEAFDDISL